MTIEQRELTFRMQVNQLIAFPYEVRKEFLEYWTEPNKSGSKMRFELEKTWDLKRRLNRWQNSPFGSKTGGKISVPEKPTEPVSKEIAELDVLLTKYRLHPTEIPFTSLANYYPYMKQEKLLKPFTAGDVESIKNMFNGDQVKCRAYCVEQTLRSYADGNFTFSHIMNLRLKVA